MEQHKYFLNSVAFFRTKKIDIVNNFSSSPPPPSSVLCLVVQLHVLNPKHALSFMPVITSYILKNVRSITEEEAENFFIVVLPCISFQNVQKRKCEAKRPYPFSSCLENCETLHLLLSLSSWLDAKIRTDITFTLSVFVVKL
jgi:hypothetical protein